MEYYGEKTYFKPQRIVKSWFGKISGLHIVRTGAHRNKRVAGSFKEVCKGKSGDILNSINIFQLQCWWIMNSIRFFYIYTFELGGAELMARI